MHLGRAAVYSENACLHDINIAYATLACLAVVNLIRRGSSINFGMWPFISDLRTGAFTGGSGEEALVTAATVQLCNHFGFTTSIGAGMTGAKTMDAEAGYEKALTISAAALSDPPSTGGNARRQRSLAVF